MNNLKEPTPQEREKTQQYLQKYIAALTKTIRTAPKNLEGEEATYVANNQHLLENKSIHLGTGYVLIIPTMIHTTEVSTDPYFDVKNYGLVEFKGTALGVNQEQIGVYMDVVTFVSKEELEGAVDFELKLENLEGQECIALDCRKNNRIVALAVGLSMLPSGSSLQGKGKMKVV